MTFLHLSTDATEPGMSGRHCNNEVAESRTDCLKRLTLALKLKTQQKQQQKNTNSPLSH